MLFVFNENESICQGEEQLVDAVSEFGLLLHSLRILP